ncbi:MAG: dihydroorotase [Chitinophagaceae bacterium]|nr:dihydroorotase [Chitinophagaceae bacterium]HQV59839.1 dihydroorotase [Chitinophagaceae bacterium]HQV86385.1 dihydroorotase [Chitinophagaceae bacterium]HQX72412.1 dihydroorotase [Chitinophagaceae bacterium]HQZ76068.1 dihydroorotase [Chitinophagaceae bacterium]
MKLLIKQARIVDPSSPFNGQSADILIDNGIISKIGIALPDKADKEIAIEGLHASPGWVDVFANFADPGYEFKETLETGAAAAAAGGYTDVMVIPNTNPSIHNKAGVEYITHKSKSLPVNIHPIGAITKNTEGKELAEMYDMKSSGAAAFSDGINCVQSAGLLVKALQYVKAFDGILIQLPDDKSINPHGLMNEGIVSTQLGLPGKPAMAEELIVARDIKLARYAGSRLHFTGVSTKKSLEYIKRGKESGTAVSCSVTPYHLFFCDEDLTDYNTNLKVNPPLRSKEDRAALQQAILNGTVDSLATHHLPHEYDSKVIEFEYAKFGMIGLETAYGVLATAVPGITAARCVELLAVNPRKLFGLNQASIKEGNPATLTLFSPAVKWTVSPENIKSKSSNSPFIGRELTGKVAGIINGDKIVIS